MPSAKAAEGSFVKSGGGKVAPKQQSGAGEGLGVGSGVADAGGAASTVVFSFGVAGAFDGLASLISATAQVVLKKTKQTMIIIARKRRFFFILFKSRR
jgi:hypothetical protein